MVHMLIKKNCIPKCKIQKMVFIGSYTVGLLNNIHVTVCNWTQEENKGVLNQNIIIYKSAAVLWN